MQKSVLVTGAGGFLGLNVVKEYSNSGWVVYALVHNNVPEDLQSIKEKVSLVKTYNLSENFRKFNIYFIWVIRVTQGLSELIRD